MRIAFDGQLGLASQFAELRVCGAARGEALDRFKMLGFHIAPSAFVRLVTDAEVKPLRAVFAGALDHLVEQKVAGAERRLMRAHCAEFDNIGSVPH